jgi:hypothetical protein
MVARERDQGGVTLHATTLIRRTGTRRSPPRSASRRATARSRPAMTRPTCHGTLCGTPTREGCQNHVHSGCGSVVLMHEATEAIAAQRTSSRCPRSSVAGVTTSPCRRRCGRSRASAAVNARSAGRSPQSWTVLAPFRGSWYSRARKQQLGRGSDPPAASEHPRAPESTASTQKAPATVAEPTPNVGSES